MKTIEEIKIELTLKMLSGTLEANSDFKSLPVNDELRTFICKISPYCAYSYAYLVDGKPLDETRTSSCKEAEAAAFYALFVDKKPHNETRKAVSVDPLWEKKYLEEFEE